MMALVDESLASALSPFPTFHFKRHSTDNRKSRRPFSIYHRRRSTLCSVTPAKKASPVDADIRQAAKPDAASTVHFQLLSPPRPGLPDARERGKGMRRSNS